MFCLTTTFLPQLVSHLTKAQQQKTVVVKVKMTLQCPMRSMAMVCFKQSNQKFVNKTLVIAMSFSFSQLQFFVVVPFQDACVSDFLYIITFRHFEVIADCGCQMSSSDE